MKIDKNCILGLQQLFEGFVMLSVWERKWGGGELKRVFYKQLILENLVVFSFGYGGKNKKFIFI